MHKYPNPGKCRFCPNKAKSEITTECLECRRMKQRNEVRAKRKLNLLNGLRYDGKSRKRKLLIKMTL